MTKDDPKIYQRRSIRLKGYDYCVGGVGLLTCNTAGTTPAAPQAGAYFVTVVAYQRECLFGDVMDGNVVLNKYGEIVLQEWEQTAIVRPNVELGIFVVMSNHLHGILIFTGDGVHAVGATRRSPLTKRHYYIESNPSQWATDNENPATV